MSWKEYLLVWRGSAGYKRLCAGENRSLLKSAASIMVVLFVLAIGVWAEKSVVIIDDGKERAVRTYAGTVGDLLAAKDIVVLNNDETTPSLDSALVNGMVITVDRAADVSISVDGQVLPVRTQCGVVGDLLNEVAIVTGPEDEVSPARDAAVIPGMSIVVARVVTKTEEKEAVLNFETKQKYTVNMPQGATRIAEEGRNGTAQQTWQVKYRDGIEIARQIISTRTITPPVNQLVMVGSGQVVSRGGENIRYAEAIDMVASAYTHTGSNTSCGVYPYYGVVAVDPAVIPLWTKLYVDGYGYATALDVGGSIIGNRIDLFFDSHDEAMNWGMRNVKVYRID
ncbi:MAG: ubiquitin-like domain-containing protein [Desulfotomaculaceae bacterium]|nr:ubiquitin-like domain-containing protein [Desulfotomaculaceae bacterium]